MFESDTYICSGLIQVNKDSICDMAPVLEYNRKVPFSSEAHGVRHTDAPDSGTHKGRERSAQGATAKMFNKCTMIYIIYILCCI